MLILMQPSMRLTCSQWCEWWVGAGEEGGVPGVHKTLLSPTMPTFLQCHSVFKPAVSTPRLPPRPLSFRVKLKQRTSAGMRSFTNFFPSLFHIAFLLTQWIKQAFVPTAPLTLCEIESSRMCTFFDPGALSAPNLISCKPEQLV